MVTFRQILYYSLKVSLVGSLTSFSLPAFSQENQNVKEVKVADPSVSVASNPNANSNQDVVRKTEVTEVTSVETTQGEVQKTENIQSDAVRVAAPESPEAKEKKWYDYIELHPFATFRLSVEFKDYKNPVPQLFRIGAQVYVNYKPFTLVLEPHILQSKSRSYYPSNVSVRQAYLKWQSPVDGLSLSAGVITNRFGYYWDGSFFGNTSVYLGKKLDQDYNVELEYLGDYGDFGLNSWLQLSPGGDGINITLLTPPKRKLLQTAGDFETDEHYSESVSARLRLEPWIKFGDFGIKPGISGQYLVANRKAHTLGNYAVSSATGGVGSVAGDLTLSWKQYSIMGELSADFIPKSLSIRQDMSIQRYYISTAVNLPVYLNKGSDWWQSVRLTGGYSYAIFKSEGFHEDIARAGIDVQVHKYVGTTVEYARWALSSMDDPLFQRLELLLKVKF